MKEELNQIILETFTRLKKIIFTSVIGEVFEGHDFIVYGLLSQILANVFFPRANRMISLMAMLLTFSIGYLTRPLGGFIFGYLGDKYGRSKAFVFTLALMGFSTFAIGLIPAYQHIGIIAPIFLIGLRLLQGFSFGGNYAGSMVFLAEHSPVFCRGFFSSFAPTAQFFGTFLGLITIAFLTSVGNEKMVIWGWRVPFLLGGALILTTLCYRKNLIETPIFQSRAKVLTLGLIFSELKKHSALAFKIAGLLFHIAVLSYLTIIFMPAYLGSFIGLSLAKTFWINTISILLLVLMIPVFGYLADYLGKKKLLIANMIGLMIFAYPCYGLIIHGDLKMVLLGQVLLMIFNGASLGVIPALLTELVPKEFRQTMIATVYNITVSVLGGTAPLLITFLIHHFQNNFFAVGYIIFAALVSLLVLLLL
jgi:MFS transporter, MHS family, proline/betaine transporter